jgi:hypothetical protein
MMENKKLKNITIKGGASDTHHHQKVTLDF